MFQLRVILLSSIAGENLVNKMPGGRMGGISFCLMILATYRHEADERLRAVLGINFWVENTRPGENLNQD